MSKARIIVGLGNPGKEFENTPHNAGVIMLYFVASSLELDSPKEIPQAAKYWKKGKIILLFPTQKMNASGPALKKTLASLKVNIKPEDILLLHDDFDIELGRAKMTFGKNAAGHKGVESVVKTLGTNKFWRLRLGIMPTSKPKDPIKYLLTPLPPDKKKKLVSRKKRVVEGAKLWADEPEKAMQFINTK